MTTPTINKVTKKRDWYITVAGVSGAFATKTGGNGTSTVTKTFDGGATTADIGTSRVDYADLTVGRPYKLERDAPVAARLRQMIGDWETTVKAQPTRQDVRVGQATTYQCVLIGVTEPDSDSNSSDNSELQLMFAVSAVL